MVCRTLSRSRTCTVPRAAAGRGRGRGASVRALGAVENTGGVRASRGVGPYKRLTRRSTGRGVVGLRSTMRITGSAASTSTIPRCRDRSARRDRRHEDRRASSWPTAYAHEQLGHASIELTVGTYGRWLRKKAPGAVDRLDRPDEVVAEPPKMIAAGTSEPRPQRLQNF